MASAESSICNRTIITQALSKDTITLGYVLAKRDLFVRDGVMGHIHVALFGEPGDVYVYGYGKQFPSWIGTT